MTPPKKGQATQILQHALELPVKVSFRLGNEMVQNLLERMWKFDQSDTPLEKFDPIKGFYTRPSPPPPFPTRISRFYLERLYITVKAIFFMQVLDNV